MNIKANVLCRGCLRYEAVASGLADPHYDFTNDPGWLPSRLIVATPKLEAMLAAAPREILTADITPGWWRTALNHEIYPEHLEHVDIRKPMLLGEYLCTETATGKRELAHVGVDGHHRLLQRLRLGLRPEFYMMTRAEMEEASYGSMREYAVSKGVIVVGGTDADVEHLLKHFSEMVGEAIRL